jgi:hypothetical protein
MKDGYLSQLKDHQTTRRAVLRTHKRISHIRHHNHQVTCFLSMTLQIPKMPYEPDQYRLHLFHKEKILTMIDIELPLCTNKMVSVKCRSWWLTLIDVELPLCTNRMVLVLVKCQSWWLTLIDVELPLCTNIMILLKTW